MERRPSAQVGGPRPTLRRTQSQPAPEKPEFEVEVDVERFGGEIAAGMGEAMEAHQRRQARQGKIKALAEAMFQSSLTFSQPRLTEQEVEITTAELAAAARRARVMVYADGRDLRPATSVFSADSEDRPIIVRLPLVGTALPDVGLQTNPPRPPATQQMSTGGKRDGNWTPVSAPTEPRAMRDGMVSWDSTQHNRALPYIGEGKFSLEQATRPSAERVTAVAEIPELKHRISAQHAQTERLLARGADLASMAGATAFDHTGALTVLSFSPRQNWRKRARKWTIHENSHIDLPNKYRWDATDSKVEEGEAEGSDVEPRIGKSEGYRTIYSYFQPVFRRRQGVPPERVRFEMRNGYLHVGGIQVPNLPGFEYGMGYAVEESSQHMVRERSPTQAARPVRTSSASEFGQFALQVAVDARERLWDPRYRIPGRFYCEEDGCGQSYNLEGNLRFHRRLRHGPVETYRCEECPKSFRRENQLERHRRIHERQRTEALVEAALSYEGAHPQKTSEGAVPGTARSSAKTLRTSEALAGFDELPLRLDDTEDAQPQDSKQNVNAEEEHTGTTSTNSDPPASDDDDGDDVGLRGGYLEEPRILHGPEISYLPGFDRSSRFHERGHRRSRSVMKALLLHDPTPEDERWKAIWTEWREGLPRIACIPSDCIAHVEVAGAIEKIRELDLADPKLSACLRGLYSAKKETFWAVNEYIFDFLSTPDGVPTGHVRKAPIGAYLLVSDDGAENMGLRGGADESPSTLEFASETPSISYLVQMLKDQYGSDTLRPLHQRKIDELRSLYSIILNHNPSEDDARWKLFWIYWKDNWRDTIPRPASSWVLTINEVVVATVAWLRKLKLEGRELEACLYGLHDAAAPTFSLVMGRIYDLLSNPARTNYSFSHGPMQYAPTGAGSIGLDDVTENVGLRGGADERASTSEIIPMNLGSTTTGSDIPKTSPPIGQELVYLSAFQMAESFVTDEPHPGDKYRAWKDLWSVYWHSIPGASEIGMLRSSEVDATIQELGKRDLVEPDLSACLVGLKLARKKTIWEVQDAIVDAILARKKVSDSRNFAAHQHVLINGEASKGGVSVETSNSDDDAEKMGLRGGAPERHKISYLVQKLKDRSVDGHDPSHPLSQLNCEELRLLRRSIGKHKLTADHEKWTASWKSWRKNISHATDNSTTQKEMDAVIEKLKEPDLTEPDLSASLFALYALEKRTFIAVNECIFDLLSGRMRNGAPLPTGPFQRAPIGGKSPAGGVLIEAPDEEEDDDAKDEELGNSPSKKPSTFEIVNLVRGLSRHEPDRTFAPLEEEKDYSSAFEAAQHDRDLCFDEREWKVHWDGRTESSTIGINNIGHFRRLAAAAAIEELKRPGLSEPQLSACLSGLRASKELRVLAVHVCIGQVLEGRGFSKARASASEQDTSTTDQALERESWTEAPPEASTISEQHRPSDEAALAVPTECEAFGGGFTTAAPPEAFAIFQHCVPPPGATLQVPAEKGSLPQIGTNTNAPGDTDSRTSSVGRTCASQQVSQTCSSANSTLACRKKEHSNNRRVMAARNRKGGRKREREEDPEENGRQNLERQKKRKIQSESEAQDAPQAARDGASEDDEDASVTQSEGKVDDNRHSCARHRASNSPDTGPGGQSRPTWHSRNQDASASQQSSHMTGEVLVEGVSMQEPYGSTTHLRHSQSSDAAYTEAAEKEDPAKIRTIALLKVLDNLRGVRSDLRAFGESLHLFITKFGFAANEVGSRLEKAGQKLLYVLLGLIEGAVRAEAQEKLEEAVKPGKTETTKEAEARAKILNLKGMLKLELEEVRRRRRGVVHKDSGLHGGAGDFAVPIEENLPSEGRTIAVLKTLSDLNGLRRDIRAFGKSLDAFIAKFDMVETRVRANLDRADKEILYILLGLTVEELLTQTEESIGQIFEVDKYGKKRITVNAEACTKVLSLARRFRIESEGTSQRRYDGVSTESGLRGGAGVYNSRVDLPTVAALLLRRRDDYTPSWQGVHVPMAIYRRPFGTCGPQKGIKTDMNAGQCEIDVVFANGEIQKRLLALQPDQGESADARFGSFKHNAAMALFSEPAPNSLLQKAYKCECVYKPICMYHAAIHELQPAHPDLALAGMEKGRQTYGNVAELRGGDLKDSEAMQQLQKPAEQFKVDGSNGMVSENNVCQYDCGSDFCSTHQIHHNSDNSTFKADLLHQPTVGSRLRNEVSTASPQHQTMTPTDVTAYDNNSCEFNSHDSTYCTSHGMYPYGYVAQSLSTPSHSHQTYAIPPNRALLFGQPTSQPWDPSTAWQSNMSPATNGAVGLIGQTNMCYYPDPVNSQFCTTHHIIHGRLWRPPPSSYIGPYALDETTVMAQARALTLGSPYALDKITLTAQARALTLGFVSNGVPDIAMLQHQARVHASQKLGQNPQWEGLHEMQPSARSRLWAAQGGAYFGRGLQQTPASSRVASWSQNVAQSAENEWEKGSFTSSIGSMSDRTLVSGSEAGKWELQSPQPNNPVAMPSNTRKRQRTSDIEEDERHRANASAPNQNARKRTKGVSFVGLEQSQQPSTFAENPSSFVNQHDNWEMADAPLAFSEILENERRLMEGRTDAQDWATNISFGGRCGTLRGGCLEDDAHDAHTHGSSTLHLLTAQQSTRQFTSCIGQVQSGHSRIPGPVSPPNPLGQISSSVPHVVTSGLDGTNDQNRNPFVGGEIAEAEEGTQLNTDGFNVSFEVPPLTPDYPSARRNATWRAAALHRMDAVLSTRRGREFFRRPRNGQTPSVLGRRQRSTSSSVSPLSRPSPATRDDSFASVASAQVPRHTLNPSARTLLPSQQLANPLRQSFSWPHHALLDHPFIRSANGAVQFQVPFNSPNPLRPPLQPPELSSPQVYPVLTPRASTPPPRHRIAWDDEDFFRGFQSDMEDPNFGGRARVVRGRQEVQRVITPPPRRRNPWDESDDRGLLSDLENPADFARRARRYRRRQEALRRNRSRRRNGLPMFTDLSRLPVPEMSGGLGLIEDDIWERNQRLAREAETAPLYLRSFVDALPTGTVGGVHGDRLTYIDSLLRSTAASGHGVGERGGVPEGVWYNATFQRRLDSKPAPKRKRFNNRSNNHRHVLDSENDYSGAESDEDVEYVVFSWDVQIPAGGMKDLLRSTGTEWGVKAVRARDRALEEMAIDPKGDVCTEAIGEWWEAVRGGASRDERCRVVGVTVLEP